MCILGTVTVLWHPFRSVLHFDFQYGRNYFTDCLQILPTPPLGGLDGHVRVTVLWPTIGSVLHFDFPICQNLLH